LRHNSSPAHNPLVSAVEIAKISTQTNVAPEQLSRFAAHHQGSLINGTVFDSSYKRGKPAAFPVNAVIHGWQETLPLMQVS
tara:strand:+ start:369 stop:611 length:243 start_codon:yes stop_codon:yes gene_type:complete